MKQFRTVNASLWQSAVDEVIARQKARASSAAAFVATAVPITRPDQSDPFIVRANEIAQAVDEQQPVPETPPPSPAEAIADTVKFCAAAAFELAEARVKAFFTHDHTELNLLKARLDMPFSRCDPRWAQVLEVYVASRIANKTIPYRRYEKLDDFVIDGRLPIKAVVALIADWGTGQEGAKKLLACVAARNPDVAIHLGDVYYSGTQHEVENYFYAIWQKVLGIPKVAWGSRLTDTTPRPATFHLPGNHDMYAGGQTYYTVIDMLGQPASYFCLRNKYWQFLAMDTGLHDANPSKEGDATFLEDSEVAWLRDKVNNAEGRKTILLSHHPLFTAYGKIGKAPVNQTLLSQLHDFLPKITAWFWGHEHNLVIYKKYLDVNGRCIGHGAFPVASGEIGAPNPDIAVDAVKLAKDKEGFFEHGYVTMEIDGAEATVTYYQYDADTGAESVLFKETM
jgi:3',5'-cyclic AMP phosphodiesterase CpdA